MSWIELKRKVPKRRGKNTIRFRTSALVFFFFLPWPRLMDTFWTKKSDKTQNRNQKKKRKSCKNKFLFIYLWGSTKNPYPPHKKKFITYIIYSKPNTHQPTISPIHFPLFSLFFSLFCLKSRNSSNSSSNNKCMDIVGTFICIYLKVKNVYKSKK